MMEGYRTTPWGDGYRTHARLYVGSAYSITFVALPRSRGTGGGNLTIIVISTATIVNAARTSLTMPSTLSIKPVPPSWPDCTLGKTFDYSKSNTDGPLPSLMIRADQEKCEPESELLRNLGDDFRISSTASTSFEREIEAERDMGQVGGLRRNGFSCLCAEAGYVASISMLPLLDEYLTSGFFALMPTLIQNLDLSNTSVTWSAGVTSLVVSALTYF